MGRTSRTISAVLLAVLVGLPVSGAVCAEICTRAAQMPSHHHSPATSQASAADCHQSPAAGPAVTAAGHDCRTHDGLFRDAAESLTAGRGDVSAMSIDINLAPTVSAAWSLTSSHPRWRGSPALLVSPSTSRSLVLRI